MPDAMPEVRDLLRSRRSPKLRALAEPGPDAGELAEILTMASRVPDHGKLVPWRFVVIRDGHRDTLNRAIGERFDATHPDATPEAQANARTRMSHAPVIVAVVSCPKPNAKVPVWEQELCAGAVCMNLLLGARARGFAAIWLTEWYAFDPEILAELGVGDQERVAGFMHIGTNDDVREDRVRPALAEIVTEYGLDPNAPELRPVTRSPEDLPSPNSPVVQ